MDVRDVRPLTAYNVSNSLRRGERPRDLEGCGYLSYRPPAVKFVVGGAEADNLMAIPFKQIGFFQANQIVPTRRTGAVGIMNEQYFQACF